MQNGNEERSEKKKGGTFAEIFRFLLVGGLATVADMFVMGVVLYAFKPSLYPKFYNVFYGGGKPSTAATVVGTGCGFIAGLLVNYILSVLFVFEHKGKSKTVGGFMLFTVLSAVGLGIHLAGMYIGYNLLHGNEWVIKILLTAVVLVYNYLSRRFILFKNDTKETRLSQGDTALAAATAGGGRF